MWRIHQHIARNSNCFGHVRCSLALESPSVFVGCGFYRNRRDMPLASFPPSPSPPYPPPRYPLQGVTLGAPTRGFPQGFPRGIPPGDHPGGYPRGSPPRIPPWHRHPHAPPPPASRHTSPFTANSDHTILFNRPCHRTVYTARQPLLLVRRVIGACFKDTGISTRTLV